MKDKKSFYRAVLILVIPLALQNLINVGVTATDVIMLGKVGEKVLSGASLGGEVQFIMTLIFFGLTSGASVLIAQYWGKGDVPTIEKVLGMSLKISVTIAFAFAVVTYAVPVPIMHLLSSDGQVVTEGAKYLRIVCFSYMFTAVTMVYLNTLRSVERVLISTVVYTVSLLTNIVMNALLIFGLFGFPQLGIRGAAIGTLIARIVEFSIVIFYDRKLNKIFRFHWRLLLVKDRMLSADFRKFSVPVIANELMWGSGVAVVAAILGQMGSAASAANSVAQVVRQLATVIAFGVSSAAAIMIGKVIGEGKTDVAREYGRRFVWISLIAGTFGAIVVLIVRPVALSQMSMSAQATQYLSAMMYVMSYFVIGQAYNTTMVVGIFRAGGDTKIGLVIDTAFMWGISILFGAIGAFVLKLSVPVVYIILLSDEVLKLPVTTWRYKKYIWLRNITR